MTRAPTISVLLPVHNGEPYLAAALDSIMAQTFKDFELISIDDGSMDGSLAILREYAARDRRIRIISREKRGLVATLNEGIELARGEWIARMDADDIAHPDRFAVQLNQIVRTGADFCGGAVECFSGWRAIWRYPESHTACEVHMLFDVPFAHPTLIGRRTAFMALRYDADFPQAQDYDLWQRAWAAGYRFTNVRQVVLRYRVHASQVSSLNQNRQRQGADLVRRRHWRALLPELDSLEIERIVDVVGRKQGRTEWVTHALRTLHMRYGGEANAVIVDAAFRLFCALAGQDKEATKNWFVLTKSERFIHPWRDIFRMAILSLLSLLGTVPGGEVYQKLRRLYFILGAFRK